MWVYTNTAVLANDQDHSRLAQRADYVQCVFTVALATDASVSRWTSPSLQRMNRLVIGNGHHHVIVRYAHDDPLVYVRLLNDSVVIHY